MGKILTHRGFEVTVDGGVRGRAKSSSWSFQVLWITCIAALQCLRFQRISLGVRGSVREILTDVLNEIGAL